MCLSTVRWRPVFKRHCSGGTDMKTRSAGGTMTLPRLLHVGADLRAGAGTHFGERWLCVGRSDALSKPGAYTLHDLLDESIIVLRDHDGILRAFTMFVAIAAHRFARRQRANCPTRCNARTTPGLTLWTARWSVRHKWPVFPVLTKSITVCIRLLWLSGKGFIRQFGSRSAAVYRCLCRVAGQVSGMAFAGSAGGGTHRL